MNVTVFLTGLLASAPLFVLGFLIGVQRRFHLISGLDAKRIADPDGLAHFAAGIITAIGPAVVAGCTWLAVVPRHENAVAAVMVAATSLLAVWLMVGLRSYLKP